MARAESRVPAGLSQGAAAYLALADRGRSDGWRYLPGLALIVACWLFAGGWLFGVVAAGGWFGDLNEFVSINASLWPLLLAVLLVLPALHGRGLSSLIAPDGIDWLKIMRGAVLWMLFAALAMVVENLVYPGRYRWIYDAAQWWPMLFTALLLTPLQCLAEELFFRGYLIQALGRLSTRPMTIAVLSSVLFTLPHLLNPEVAAYGMAIMAVNYFAMGLLLALCTLRDGRLELAIGAHAGNNLLLAAGVSYEGSVFRTPALWSSGALDPVYSLITLLIGGMLFYFWFFGRSSWTIAFQNRK